MSLTDGFLILLVCFLFLLHLSNNVFAVNKSLKPTYCCHVSQREHVLGLKLTFTGVLILLQHNSLEQNDKKGTDMDYFTICYIWKK